MQLVTIKKGDVVKGIFVNDTYVVLEEKECVFNKSECNSMCGNGKVLVLMKLSQDNLTYGSFGTVIERCPITYSKVKDEETEDN